MGQPASRVSLLGLLARGGLLMVSLPAVLALTGCTTYQPFDSAANFDAEVDELVPSELRDDVARPYEIDEAIRDTVLGRVNPGASDSRRTEEILSIIFSSLDLQYSLQPTRNAVETWRDREGNCLSFVNLFVGVGRDQRLNPFYVEVEDYQRWHYEDGVVVSRGHIVAGMYIDGQLSTFDFLPYAPKAYRQFKPIDDIVATAHFYNNLGAEAMMRGELEAAEEHLRIAVALAPEFDKAANNLGVALLRTERAEEAVTVLESGLDLVPDNVPLLTNLTRAYQQLGRVDEADELLDRLDDINQHNPFFYVYRGSVALGKGDLELAMDYMRRAFRTDSELPEVHVGLARVYLALGQLKQARHHISRALRLDATHEEARKYAALIERSLPSE